MYDIIFLSQKHCYFLSLDVERRGYSLNINIFKGTDNDRNRDKKDRKMSAMSYSLMDLKWLEISEFMSSSLPLFKDIMLILKGLLHNFPS